MSVKNVDNQIDHVIDKQLDMPDQVFTEITRKSRVFSIPYMGPIYEPLPLVGLPNINVATTEVVQVSNYPLLNGIYTKGFDENIGIYFIRDDGQYYFWCNLAVSLIWQFEELPAGEVIADRLGHVLSSIPAEGWTIPATSQPIPLQISFLG